MYVGRVWLKYPEEDLWRLTPRQFKAQLDVHVDLESCKYGKSTNKAQPIGFIDQIPGW